MRRCEKTEPDSSKRNPKLLPIHYSCRLYKICVATASKDLLDSGSPCLKPISIWNGVKVRTPTICSAPSEPIGSFIIADTNAASTPEAERASL